MRFVFTGSGVDHKGEFRQRKDIFSDVRLYGHIPEESMSTGTNVLVASRLDTTKAAMASRRGIEVWTYAQFWTYLLGRVRTGTPLRVPVTIGRTQPAFRDRMGEMPLAQPHPVPMGHILSNGKRAIDL